MEIVFENLPILIIGIIALFTIYILLNRPMTGIIFVSVYVLLQALWGNSAPALNLGMVSLYPLDLLAVILCIVAILRFIYLKENRNNRFLQIITAILIFCVFSFLAGMQRYGLERAGNYARPYIYFLSVIFYTAGIKANQKYFSLLLKIFTWISLSLLVIGLIRLYLVHTGYTNYSWLAAGGMDIRVLNANQAFILLQCLIIDWFALLYKWKMPLKKILPYILFPSVIFLQHRTVWVVGAICIFILLLLEKKIRLKLINSIILGSIILVCIGLLIYGSEIFRSLKGSASNSATFLWRLESWQSLLQNAQQRGWIPNLIGNPFGTGYGRLIQGNLIEVSPHNYYIQVFMDTGIIGTIILLCLYALVTYRFHISIDTNGLSNLILTLIISQLIFFILIHLVLNKD